MIIERNTFQSKVARRIFIAFSLVIMLPLGLITYATYQQTQELITQKARELAKSNAKRSGQIALSRLTLLDGLARQTIVASTQQSEKLQPLLQQISNRHPGLAVSYWHDGELLAHSGATDQQLRPLPSQLGSRVELSAENHGITYRLQRINASGHQQIGIVIPWHYLWRESELGAGERLCIKFASQQSSHCVSSSSDEHDNMLNAFQKRADDWQSPQGNSFIQVVWQLPLSHLFGSKSPLLISAVDRELIDPRTESFEFFFSLSILLALATLTVACITTVRRILNPIKQLTDATKQLAKRNFPIQLQVNSKDEFADLAVAFEAMAAELAEHFKQNQSRTELDNQLIASSELSPVTQIVLNEALRLTSASQVALYLFDFQPQSHYSHCFVQHSEQQNHTVHKADTLVLHNLLLKQKAASNELTPYQLQALSRAKWTNSQLHYQAHILDTSNEPLGVLLLGYPSGRKTVLIETAQEALESWLSHCSLGLESLRQTRRLIRQATIDSLTGISNRQGLEIRLAEHLKLGGSGLFMLLDIDRFKQINDNLGHHIGDLLLKSITHKIQSLLENSALLARFGGDEFTLFFPNIYDADEAQLQADRISRALSTPLFIDGYQVEVDCNIGLYLIQRGNSVAEVLRNADIAMHRAQEAGRNTSALFNQHMSQAVERRLALENYLNRAIEKRSVHLCFQPKVSLETGEIDSFEALIRFDHPEKLHTDPTELVAIAEETGIILELGYYVLIKALKQLVSWQQQLAYSGSIAINISAVQLFNDSFIQQLEKVLEDTGADPSKVELEVTEKLLIDNEELASERLAQIRAKGIKVAVDDFGTGYSSLSHISRLPVDRLKIDRSFIQDIAEGQQAQSVVKSIINVAQNLNLSVTAEGIEDEVQLAFLRMLNCDQGQGFLFDAPLTQQQAIERLQQQMSYIPASSELNDQLIAETYNLVSVNSEH